MTFSELKSLLTHEFGTEALIGEEELVLMPNLTVRPESLVPICEFLRNDERTYFDSLSCLTALDNGTDTFEVAYNLFSIPYEHALCLKVKLPRQEGTPPAVNSVSEIWRTANWHEREAYDLMGIHFEGHPDLRRILLPEDWEGHPLRKDYTEQERYHGITVKYEA
ncbi:NADH-quinone oxidoreductase subunit C [Siphonobacter sp. SORGH_AS_0500]|uniref:NADH-quinone oxidoreductase subunit C n=1 Tax=Siphonobacter sp. SORGH_AS_0500 TaxID=1864824 RepID=UPI000CB95142|nr:NADH-quinone oxidoreductase subunit C [Siphonobacter sp. SORGH_AS_0500]PKK34669.1 NADH-quinone oxidoreductase subunit C [Siphonobacter sp. SORGH_AS_0500]